MSKQDFDRIKKVGDVMQAFQYMEELLGVTPKIFLPDNYYDRWQELETEYNNFYALPLQERLYFAELATKKVGQHE